MRPPLYSDRKDAGRRLADKLRHYADDQGGYCPCIAAGRSSRRIRGGPFSAGALGCLPGPETRGSRPRGTGHGRHSIGRRSSSERQCGPSPEHHRGGHRSGRAQGASGDGTQGAFVPGRSAPPAIHGRKVILVDDGLATGASMRAAVAALRKHGPAEIVVAVPTAPPETCREFESEVDRIVCAETPRPFQAVGLWYEDFSQTTDDEVRRYMEQA